MHICKECGREIQGPNLFHDLFGAFYCAWCYARLMPPHPGSRVDPQWLDACDYVRQYDEAGGFV